MATVSDMTRREPNKRSRSVIQLSNVVACFVCHGAFRLAMFTLSGAVPDVFRHRLDVSPGLPHTDPFALSCERVPDNGQVVAEVGSVQTLHCFLQPDGSLLETVATLFLDLVW